MCLKIQNRQAIIMVLPPAASLIIKGLMEPPRAKRKSINHNGNLSFDDVMTIARPMRPRSMAKYLNGTVKVALGLVN